MNVYFGLDRWMNGLKLEYFSDNNKIESLYLDDEGERF